VATASTVARNSGGTAAPRLQDGRYSTFGQHLQRTLEDIDITRPNGLLKESRRGQHVVQAVRLVHTEDAISRDGGHEDCGNGFRQRQGYGSHCCGHL
jgi:hypothetical protein